MIGKPDRAAVERGETERKGGDPVHGWSLRERRGRGGAGEESEEVAAREHHAGMLARVKAKPTATRGR